MKKVETVLKSVTEKMTPTNGERSKTEAALNRIVSATKKVLKPLDLTYMLAGSFLRDTWLTDKKEFDIFILFPESVPREDLEKKGIAIGKKIVSALKGKYVIAYAEHPYIRADIGGYAVDFVPCYDIKEAGRIKSAVDRTPHHNRYILKKLKPKLSNDVRLLKQFCKGIGTYGSDLRVEGFSGYLSELLIIKYGSFKNLLLEASKWNAGKVFIDLEGHHEDTAQLKEKFPAQPLIVIDPVDRNRNVSAALSPANFELFRRSCESFLKSPSEAFFRPKKSAMNAKSLKKAMEARGTMFLCLSMKRPDVVDDVLFPQLRRSAKRLLGMVGANEFKVLGYDVWCDEKECALLFELEVWELPPVVKLKGPPIFSESHSRQFIKKYRGKNRLWVEGGFWVTEARRRFPHADRFMASVLKTGKKRLSEMGISSYVASALVKGFSLMKKDQIVRKAEKKKDFALFLSHYFRKKIL